MKLERLRQLRREQNISQADLAKAFDVHQTAICQWENGRANPDFEKLKRIAAFFGVTVDYLLENEVAQEVSAEAVIQQYTAASGGVIPKPLTNFDFALFDELNKLDETQKQDVLNFARFIRSKSTS